MIVELGVTARDRITGFTGVVTGRVQYISGCNQVLVSPRVSADGAMRESSWIDEQRVIVCDGVSPVELDNGDNPGFDKPAPKR